MKLQGPFHRRALGLLEHSGKPATNGTGKDVTAAGRFMTLLPIADM